VMEERWRPRLVDELLWDRNQLNSCDIDLFIKYG